MRSADKWADADVQYVGIGRLEYGASRVVTGTDASAKSAHPTVAATRRRGLPKSISDDGRLVAGGGGEGPATDQRVAGDRQSCVRTGRKLRCPYDRPVRPRQRPHATTERCREHQVPC